MIIFMGIVCFIFSVLFSLFVVFCTLRFIIRINTSLQLDDMEKGNTAMATVHAANLIAFGLLMAKCMYPMSAILQNLFLYEFFNFVNTVKTGGYILIYFIIAYILSFLTVQASFWLFQMLTLQLNEKEQLKKNNMTIALLLAAVVITVAIMVRPGLADALNTLIPPAGFHDVRLR